MRAAIANACLKKQDDTAEQMVRPRASCPYCRTVVLNCLEELCTSETVEDNRSTLGKRSMDDQRGSGLAVSLFLPLL